ncbi:MAG TPA: EAL domain-containing protein [Mycobacteriales bacterium]|nr:EAL domain-containing protein [Mycobacteriales bacterium]
MAGCGDCVCERPARGGGGRVVLATSVDHTATALRSLARRDGGSLRVLAPGLLELVDGDAAAFLARARAELSSVEADEVRVADLRGDLGDPSVLAAALTAPTLSAAGARVEHADLLPLFDDEAARFRSVYQPIVDLAGERRVVGHEALLRATRPDGTPVLPAQLFPAAAAAGWSHVLDRIGRTTALRHAGPWLAPDELLFINFVPTSIYRPSVCLRTTERAAQEAGLRLDQLVFEVTEGERVHDVDHLREVFDHYRARGCKVALDDLGAGWSSLTMLVQLRPDVVKLDKEIVQALPDDVSSSVVAAVVDIVHGYGGTVLAECVETEEQAQAARALGVDLAQGWLFGRPQERSAPAPGRAVPAGDPDLPDAAVRVAARRPSPPALDRLLSRAVEASRSGVVVVDMTAPGQPMVFVNDAFAAQTGYARDELLGRNPRVLQGPATDRSTVAGVRAAVAEGREHRCVLLNVRKDRSPWWNELDLSPVHDGDGRLTHYLGFQVDVTARVEAEQRLQRLAASDPLTGLPNRTSLVEGLEAALAGTGGRATAVVFLDLDGFKAVTDAGGHAAGDTVLAEVAVRLRAALRADDLLARHGGDEFVAVLAGLDPLDAERVATRAAADAVAALVRPYPGAPWARVSACAGIALAPAHGTTAAALLHAADTAMYEAKAAGPGAVRVSGGSVWAPAPQQVPQQVPQQP